MKINIICVVFFSIFFISCAENSTKKINYTVSSDVPSVVINLSADLDTISPYKILIINNLIQASKYMDSMFFYENCEDFIALYKNIQSPEIQEKFKLNFGPWDRYNDNKSFVNTIGNKPEGANFYPPDITKDEFNALDNSCKNSHYTFIRRDSLGQLYCLSYHQQFKRYNDSVSYYLNKAADLCGNTDFAKYLRQRSIDLHTDKYFISDSMWLSLKDNVIDLAIGPIEILDDQFLNLKAEHQAFLLLRDEKWSIKTQKYNSWLKFLQKAIPVPEEYRREEPGKQTSLSVYNIVDISGSASAGGTYISLILPLESSTQMSQGVKNIQFKNIIDAKFEHIVKPISQNIFADNIENKVTAESFLFNTILYEMANTLGIRNTLKDNIPVRNQLKDYYIISNQIKNYSLSLFIADKLNDIGELPDDVTCNYTVFIANLVRKIRLGQNSEYSKSNLIFFNYLTDNKVVEYTIDGKITINFSKIKPVNEKLINKIIIIQGDGNYNEIENFVEKYLYIDENLYNLITNINNKKIPIDINVKSQK